MNILNLLKGGAVISLLLTVFSAQAVVWDGEDVSFTKENFADPTLEANQDRITDNVWITRGDQQPLFNIAPGQESAYSGPPSPAGTQWAFAGNDGNPGGAAFSAAQHVNLNFSNFTLALDGPIKSTIVGTPAVVHLVNEDIYIDIEFSAWSGGTAPGGQTTGGGFAYTRSGEPAAVAPVKSVPVPVWAIITMAIGISGIRLLRSSYS